MRRAVAIVAVTLISATAWSFQNEPNGFRGITWGDSIEQHKDALAEVERGRSVFYRRKDDKLQIGEAELTSIIYGFYQERFSTVMLKTQTYSNKQSLIRAFQAQFGSGDKPNRYIDRWFWRGATTNITLDCGSSRDECTAVMWSVTIQQQERADRKAGAQKAKEDF